MYMMHSVKGMSLLFLALGVGYMVSVSASKEKGFLKNLGYVIAAVILLGCFAAITMKVSMASHCKMMKKKMGHGQCAAKFDAHRSLEESAHPAK